MEALDFSKLLGLLVSEFELSGIFQKINRHKIVDLPEKQQNSLSILLSHGVVKQRMLGNPFLCKTPVRFIIKARAVGNSTYQDLLLDPFLQKVCSVIISSNVLKENNFDTGADDLAIIWNPQEVFDLDETVAVAEVIGTFTHRIKSSAFIIQQS